MHHRHREKGQKGPRARVPSSAINRMLDPRVIEALLEGEVPDPQDRAFVARCIVSEGPIHHRGASFAILGVLGALLDRAPAAGSGEPRDVVAVPMRLPPHLEARGDEEQHYPLSLPTAPLELIAEKGSAEFDALVDCLLDGPPHHVLANVATLTLLDALLVRLAGTST